MGSKNSAVTSTGASARNTLSIIGGGIFLKPFKTIDEQIALLKQRGLHISDESMAKKALLGNNYYNIINGYSKYFPMRGDTYTGGTTFDEVTHLYLFDGEIKQAFFRAILAAETHLKSIFAHRFAEQFQNIPYPYLNIACYDVKKALDVVTTIHKLSGIINRKRQDRTSSIYHYLTRYDNVPIWVLVNHLDFGDLRYMLANSQPRIQNSVAKDLTGFIRQHIQNPSTFPPEVMLAFLANINEMRNVCAHNNRLVGFRCRRDDKYWSPLHQSHNIPPNGNRRDAYSIYLALQCFLSSTEYNILHNTLRKRMNYVSLRLHSITLNDILNELGFPDDWNKSVSKMLQQPQCAPPPKKQRTAPLTDEEIEAELANYRAELLAERKARSVSEDGSAKRA